MPKKNCWEIMNCGHEDGGRLTADHGVCPASTKKSYDGINGGKNGGRSCWSIIGTKCFTAHQNKIIKCIECEVLKQVQLDEGSSFSFLVMPDPSKD